MTPCVSVSAIAIYDDQILMIRRGHGPAQGKWSVPGGKVRFGETLAEALVRELLEETGLQGICGEFVGICEKIDDEDHYVIIAHLAELIDEYEDPIAGDDAQEVRWIATSELSDYDIVDGLLEFLHDNELVEIIT